MNIKEIMPGKIKFRLRILLLFVVYNFWITIQSNAQPNVANKYGLLIVNDIRHFENTVSTDSNKQMLDIKKCLPGALLDLRYATCNNFMHQKLYPSIHTTYLRRAAITSLKKVVKELKKENLTIKIFDAYRPYYVTEKMWEMIKDDRYAADPSKGSGHNRGAAVDLTLVEKSSMHELPMGTGFDNFSDTAHTGFARLPANILQNRKLLKSIMEKYGFVNLDTEWWHFSLQNAETFELLNLKFDQLKMMSPKCRTKVH